MACQKMAASGVIGSGQIADPVLADGFGRVKEEDMKSGRKRGGNEAKVRGRVLPVRMAFCCVRPLEGRGGLGGAVLRAPFAHGCAEALLE
jgi:hypothetical protein